MRLKRWMSAIMVAGTAMVPLAAWAEGPADEAVAAPDAASAPTDPRTSPDPGSSNAQPPDLSGTGSGSGDTSAAPRSTAGAGSGSGARGDSSRSSSAPTAIGADDASQDANQQRSWSGP